MRQSRTGDLVAEVAGLSTDAPQKGGMVMQVGKGMVLVSTIALLALAPTGTLDS